MSKQNIKANFIQKNSKIYNSGKIIQNHNTLEYQLNSKSVFMVAKDGIKIDFDGDGIYDKKINYQVNSNNNIENFNIVKPEYNSNEESLSQRLNNLYGNLGFSFSTVGQKTSNENYLTSQQSQKAQEQHPPEITFNQPEAETKTVLSSYSPMQTSYMQKQTTNSSIENLKSSIENLNLDGVKVEIINNYPK